MAFVSTATARNLNGLPSVLVLGPAVELPQPCRVLRFRLRHRSRWSRLPPSWLTTFTPSPGKPPAPRVRSTSCAGASLGWWMGPCCEQCQAAAERASDAKHRAAVGAQDPDAILQSAETRISQFMAELAGKGEDRGTPGRKPYKRLSRARHDDKLETREHVPLSTAESQAALAFLDSYPLRRIFAREEWLGAVWVEIVTPPAGLTPAPTFTKRLERAIWRAEKEMKSNVNPKRSLAN